MVNRDDVINVMFIVSFDYVLRNFNLKSIFTIFKRMERNGVCDDEEKP